MCIGFRLRAMVRWRPQNGGGVDFYTTPSIWVLNKRTNRMTVRQISKPRVSEVFFNVFFSHFLYK